MACSARHAVVTTTSGLLFVWGDTQVLSHHIHTQHAERVTSPPSPFSFSSTPQYSFPPEAPTHPKFTATSQQHAPGPNPPSSTSADSAPPLPHPANRPGDPSKSPAVRAVGVGGAPLDELNTQGRGTGVFVLRGVLPGSATAGNSSQHLQVIVQVEE